jgi:hypothetical protein
MFTRQVVDACHKYLRWVVSRRLAKSYIESVSTSEFGATTDIRQTPGYEHVISPVLLSSAKRRPLAQCKTATEAAVSVDKVVTVYAFLRLAMATNPIRPEPKSQTAAGAGTADTPTVKASPQINAWS